MVQWTPWWWAAAGCAALVAVGAIVPLSTGSVVAGMAYVVVSSVLLAVGQQRRGTVRFGAANAVTAARSMLVAIVTAMVVASLADAVPTTLLVSIAVCALVLDAVDGFVARRTRGESALGARFDMEVDAFLILVLSVYDMRFVGWWVVTIGLMRYAFVAAGWLLPWMSVTLPHRYWRKVIAATCGIALVVVAAQIAPLAINLTVAAVALLLLVESFGRDVIWLLRARPRIASDRRSAPAHDGRLPNSERPARTNGLSLPRRDTSRSAFLIRRVGDRLNRMNNSRVSIDRSLCKKHGGRQVQT